MDFEKAQYEEPAAAAVCAACKRGIDARYWTVGTATVCETCAAQVAAGPPPGGAVLRALKAFVFGSGAGLAGAVGYGLIIHYAHVELALVTILIGWMVGRSVRFGSEGRGGRGYQVLGALQTYVWCMMAYVPDIVTSLSSSSSPDKEPMPTVVAAIIAPFAALVVPFTGAMGVLGTLILAFGVWRGWREPAAVKLVVAGPFELSALPPPAAEPAPAQTP